MGIIRLEFQFVRSQYRFCFSFECDASTTRPLTPSEGTLPLLSLNGHKDSKINCENQKYRLRMALPLTLSVGFATIEGVHSNLIAVHYDEATKPVLLFLTQTQIFSFADVAYLDHADHNLMHSFV
ncbi:hypothetical protein EVAR_25111_1 [Eumeta japonica]|uniref:Uncharacterized protein n=1 Tax=Eumeta variegata TaxID=151549 RepID=A0A4C1XLH3_EUMVA|nr:hypothetical protein EVAR_25111_1 [Eumeta japonica]